MAIGFGKIVEDLKYQQAQNSLQVVSATTLYNGYAADVTSQYIDTQDYDDMNVIINAGEFEGAGALDVTVVAGDTDASGSATLVTGATFTQITSANDLQQHIGSIRVRSQARYHWVKVVKSGTGTVNFGVNVVLAKGTASHPISNSPVFDVN